MNTSLHRLVTVVLLILGGLSLASPARASDALITYDLPSADPTGMTAQVAPGVAGCLNTCGTLKLAAGVAVPARRQGLLAFSAPAGTTIVKAALRLRYRTKQSTVSAHLQSRIGGRWIDGQRLRSASGTTATVNTGQGATAVAVTLTADGAVPARTVRTDTENLVSVASVQLAVRDLSLPSVAWTTGDPVGGGWQRGSVCGAFAARDAGLGVDHVEFTVGGTQGIVVAGPGSRLQPRPLAFDGTVCVDSSQVGDGTYGTALTAVDAGAAGNRSTSIMGIMRIDNTAPVVNYLAPADAEARLPAVQLTVTDPTSGVERVAATIDGLPAALSTTGVTTLVRPLAPLADGTHRLSWEAGDVAGNVTTGSALFGVADTTPPAIDSVEPVGVSSPTASIMVRATDTGTGLSSEGWRLAVDGIDVTGAAEVSSTGLITYAPPRSWAEGDHVARVTVVDRSGNRNVRTWTFSIPVTPTPQPTPAPAPVVEAASASVEAGATTPAPDAAPAGRASLVLQASVRRVRVGAQLRLRGRLVGATRTRVQIEARVGTVWRVVVQVPLSPTGSFATPVRLPAPGTYAVRARAGRTLSKTLQLTAR